MATPSKTAPKTAGARKAPAKPRTAPTPRTRAKPRAATSSVPGVGSALSVGAAILTVGAAIAGFLARRQIAAWVSPDDAGHKAPDLAPGKPRDARAPVDFRPNMAAPISAADREALRPAGPLDRQTGAPH